MSLIDNPIRQAHKYVVVFLVDLAHKTGLKWHPSDGNPAVENIVNAMTLRGNNAQHADQHVLAAKVTHKTTGMEPPIGLVTAFRTVCQDADRVHVHKPDLMLAPYPVAASIYQACTDLGYNVESLDSIAETWMGSHGMDKPFWRRPGDDQKEEENAE